MDLLFRGLLIDCTNVKDAAGKGVCAILKNNADNFVVLEENKYLFSVFGTVIFFLNFNFFKLYFSS